MHWFLTLVIVALIAVSAYNYVYFDKDEKGEHVKHWVKDAKMINLAVLILGVLALVYCLWLCYSDGKLNKFLPKGVKSFSPSVYAYSPFDF